MEVKKRNIQKHLKPNGRELSWVFQVGCNYRTLDSWLQILGSKLKFWYTETSTNISCKLIITVITALDISKYEGKVVMMAFGCLWLKYEKKSWINSPEMEVTHCFLLTKATRTKLLGNIFDIFFVLKYGTHVFGRQSDGTCTFQTWAKQQEKALPHYLSLRFFKDCLQKVPSKANFTQRRNR